MLSTAAKAEEEFHQTTGVKVGEVSSTSAVVWMRFTRDGARNETGALLKGKPQPLPIDTDPSSLHGATPGAPGKVRLHWSDREDLTHARSTDWESVGADSDFTHQFHLTGLNAATRYYYRAETAGEENSVAHRACRGTFRTAPHASANSDVVFTVMTCQAYSHLDHPAGFHIYPSMQGLRPDFMVATGDNVYLDNEHPRATTVGLARYHWNRMYSLPRLIAFHLAVPAYWEKDDHDTLMNDFWPGKRPERMAPLTEKEGRRIFYEQTPAPVRPYRSVRWGKLLEIWLPEVRDFRSANTDPDGPKKTIWGTEQKEWLKRTLQESDAGWKLIISPTPIVGPDREGKSDNHANAGFAHEGNEFRKWLQQLGNSRVFVICGDRHWQYHSVDPGTGLHEFSCGPASDEHAEGSPGENPRWHRFHRQKGGFLSVVVKSAESGPRIEFRFHDVYGKVLHRHLAFQTS